jgi:hypothetical protein
MSPRLDGARDVSLSHWLALTPFILQKSRMRKRARTDLCGGRSAMVVPTATTEPPPLASAFRRLIIYRTGGWSAALLFF